jgi:DNA processing protein
MTTHTDDPHFLRLAHVHGVGAQTAHKLLAELGDVESIFASNASSLSRIVGETLAKKITTLPTATVQTKIDEAMTWLASSAEHHLLTWAHPSYPKALLESGDAPLAIYAKGRLELLARRAVAMVGSRNCSVGGADTAESFAQAFAESGVTVVSGLALGIDAASHVGALRAKGSACGSTIAVIGTGIDRVYPAGNKVLAHSIAEHGLLLSEYPLGTPPLPANFPKRNRIISGLSLGVLVVEASMQSGSLITARLAGEQGREVFAIPGSIHSTFHKGCHHLIKQGAKLVETANDVLDELRVETVASVTETTADNSVKTGLLKFIEHTPIDVDTLVARSSMPIDQIVTELTMLELDGSIESLPGGRWQRRG